MVMSIYTIKQGFQYLKYFYNVIFKYILLATFTWLYVEEHQNKLDIEKYFLIWKINVLTIYEDAGPGIGRGDLMNVV